MSVEIITATSKGVYDDFLEVNEYNCKKLGYKYIVYETQSVDWWKDGQVGIGQIQGLPKPQIIYDHIKNQCQSEYCIWIDIDAIIRKKIDEILINDIVCTPRLHNHILPPDTFIHLINNGIMVFRKTEKLYPFFEKWINNIKEDDNVKYESSGEEHHFSKLVCDIDHKWLLNHGWGQELVLPRKPQYIFGNIGVSFVDTRIYNQYYTFQDLDIAKIYHFKGEFRDKYRHLLPKFKM
jgi:hypothetical protein